MKWLDHLEEEFITILIAAATLVIFVAVVHRYASGMPLGAVQDALLDINMSWAQELCIILFVWMAKFGAAYGVRQGIHVGVDVWLTADTGQARIISRGLCAGIFYRIVAMLGYLVWENGLAYVSLIRWDGCRVLRRPHHP